VLSWVTQGTFQVVVDEGGAGRVVPSRRRHVPTNTSPILVQLCLSELVAVVWSPKVALDTVSVAIAVGSVGIGSCDVAMAVGM
jgi:hypothetical protein